MSVEIRPAQPEDVGRIMELVNRFAALNVMLPRTEQGVRRSLGDWLVAVDDKVDDKQAGAPVVGCGSLVALTPTLVEVRSLAVDDSQQGTGLGSRLVTELVTLARERGFEQVCALTLRANFFERLGFAVVDRWSISPKVWQACIYCPKFHRCDEVAVLMNLGEPATTPNGAGRTPGWNRLLKYGAWQPLKLAYQHKPGEGNE
jgi:amino-acid N-acetyltransferase